MARSVSKKLALDKLDAHIRAMDGLGEAGPESPQFDRWRNDVLATVKRILSDDAKREQSFAWKLSTIGGSPLGSNLPRAEAFSRNLAGIREALGSMRQEVEDYWEDDAPVGGGNGASRPPLPPASRSVFVVHGRDGGLRDTVARFLQDQGLIAVILQEQPDRNRTVIEKLEQSTDVGYAVVILNGEDEGRLVAEGEPLRPRARQNVIFELGYLVGKLTRARVTALYEGGDLELPSDYAGVLYTPIDAHGAWKLQLCRNLRDAGLEVDANRIR